jgi:hypothetical protein
MPSFQDRRIHKPTGIEYRYEAEYAERGSEAVWSAVVSFGGRSPQRLAGTVAFDSESTAAFSAVAASVREKIDSGALMHS